MNAGYRAYNLNLAISLVAMIATALVPAAVAQDLGEVQPRVLRAQPIVPAPLADVLDLPEVSADTLLDEANEQKAEALASFIEGLLHEQAGQVDRMMVSFQTAFDLDPQNTLLAEKLALEYVRSGDVPSGIGVLKDAIKINPDKPRLHLLTATLYARSLKKLDRAQTYVTQALELDPTNTDAYEIQLGIHLANENRSAARQVLMKASNLEVTEPDFWLGCGELAARILSPNPEAADSEDRALIDLFYDKAASLIVDQPPLLFRIGEYYLLTRQTDQAIDVLARAVADLPQDSVIWFPVHNLLARAYLLGDRRDEAIKLLEQMLEVNPLQRETYELLGNIYEESGDLEKALAQFQQAILIESDTPLNYLRAADIYVRLGTPDKAVKILQEARRKITNVPQLTYSLAIAYGQVSRYQLAVDTFELALDEARFLGDDIASAAFYFNYGIVADKAGQFAKAKELFQKVIELEPENSAPALNYLGYMMVLRRDNLDQAESLIRRAIEQDPENGAYIDSLGWLFYQRGDYQQALETLLRAEKLIDHTEPMNYEIFDHIGDTYSRLNNLAKAIEYWQKAIQLVPEETQIAEKIDLAAPKVTSQKATVPDQLPE